MTEERPQRVRVTAPPRRKGTAHPRSRLGDVHDQTALGGIYLRSLMREQLLLAARVLALILITLGGLPLLFRLAPHLADRHLLGLPIAWALLGVLVYPFLLLLGWRYVRRVERNERDFTELVRADHADDR